MALKIGSLVLGLGTFFVMFKKVKGLKKYGLASLFYVLAFSVLLSVSTLILLFKQEVNEMYLLISAQFIILLLGTIHVAVAKKALPWYYGQTFNMQLIFIICILLLGYFFFNLSFTFLTNPEVEFVWYLSLLWFLVPVLLNQTIIKLLEVPSKIYKEWTYPLNVTIEDPSDEEMENPVVISFVFKKRHNDREVTTFRAKAPEAMHLGRLFYFFINDYNSRHPEGPISCADINNEPHKWIFFRIRNKFLNIKAPLDPDDSIFVCKIRENDVITCERISSNGESDNAESAEETGSFAG